VRAHALDQIEFGGGDGFPFCLVEGQDAVVFGLVFGWENLGEAADDIGCEAVDGVVAGRDCLAFRRGGPGRKLGVGLVGRDLGG
jgi:hypothetical protein